VLGEALLGLDRVRAQGEIHARVRAHYERG